MAKCTENATMGAAAFAADEKAVGLRRKERLMSEDFFDKTIDTLFAGEITVLGIGNVILRDEGFGVRVVEHLAAVYDFPPKVNLIDGGTLGIELTQFVTGTQKLLIIDSINGGKKGGAKFRFDDDEVTAHFADKISAHEVGIQDVLTQLKITGRKIPKVTVIGVQPVDVSAGVGLSATMEELLPQIAEWAVEILAEWGIDVIPKKRALDVNLGEVAEATAKFARR